MHSSSGCESTPCTLRDVPGDISGRDLVPGDIVRIRAGDFVPADAKILDGHLEVDQSALTGESLMVPKKQDATLFSGLIIKSVRNRACAVTTGTKTYFGKTTELVHFALPRLRPKRSWARS